MIRTYDIVICVLSLCVFLLYYQVKPRYTCEKASIKKAQRNKKGRLSTNRMHPKFGDRSAVELGELFAEFQLSVSLLQFLKH